MGNNRNKTPTTIAGGAQTQHLEYYIFFYYTKIVYNILIVSDDELISHIRVFYSTSKNGG
ncbi:hypothetical protein COMNV_00631 [Commensalibacter sp. Nvir]|uniref:hypothetical protein n=1 Tax=Commensalibacter sp. Nvir TaxID=3069817 RepID=UPI002D46908E|nr:hypothetical protein COMNV_00631 [Commensalibacter sp. Nvir]